MHENGRMRPVETSPGVGGGIKENDGGVNSTMRYCKHFGKCHNVSPVQQKRGVHLSILSNTQLLFYAPGIWIMD
jgi:hypothetical protein